MGSCPDNTLATSCDMDLIAGFVDAGSNVYLMDRGRIRGISSGNIVTIAGQSPSFGDGGLATNARFGTVWNVQQRNDGNFVVLDTLTQRFRMFTEGGNISTIAGNDRSALPNTSSPAAAQSIFTQNENWSFTAFFLDPSNNDLYYGMIPNIFKLSNSTGFWSLIGGGGGTMIHQASNGVPATSIYFGSGILLGYSGSSLLFQDNEYVDNVVTNCAILGEIDLAHSDYELVAGNVSTLASYNGYCSDGTSGTACPNARYIGNQSNQVASGAIVGSYDSTTGNWIIIDADSRTLRTISLGGPFGTWTTLGNTALSFTAVRIGGTPYIYYCSSAGRIFLRNVLTSTEVQLPWTIPSAKCSAFGMTYNNSTLQLTFPIVQNGIYGIGQLIQADPADNGI